jgi:hypothetical protein
MNNKVMIFHNDRIYRIEIKIKYQKYNNNLIYNILKQN